VWIDDRVICVDWQRWAHFIAERGALTSVGSAGGRRRITQTGPGRLRLCFRPAARRVWGVGSADLEGLLFPNETLAYPSMLQAGSARQIIRCFLVRGPIEGGDGTSAHAGSHGRWRQNL